MVEPTQLHPSIRKREAARISASALAEYVLLTPDRQDEILHDAAYTRGVAVSKYGDALRAIISYCDDPKRPPEVLDEAHEALIERSAATTLKPSTRDEAVRCAEVIDLLRSAENAFGIGGLPLTSCPKFNNIIIAGVKVSVQPDLIVGVSYPTDQDRIGAAIFRPQKRPNPLSCKTTETKVERESVRREMAKYMNVLMHLAIIENGTPDNLIDRKRLFVFDLRLGERIGFPSDGATRLRRIKAACGQIGRLWETVQPKPGDYAKPA